MSLDKTNSQVLRIVDSNINRLSEGLRVLEDIARMILNAPEMTATLKTMRHDLIRADGKSNYQLIQSRNSQEDVGIDIEVSGEAKSKDILGLLVANSRRAQESLRVLEEICKLPEIPFDSENYKQARFSLYTLERDLFSRLLRRDKIQKIKGLYVVIDTLALNGRSHVEVAEKAIRGGARIIQLRDKQMSRKDLFATARQVRELCSAGDVLFIINDYLDIALAVGSDGLHIGQDDLPIAVARKQLPIDKIIGLSATTFEQAAAAQNDGADYIGFGAIYPTASKNDIEVAGLDALVKIKKSITIPVVAIGGINEYNVKDTLAAGADAVAVISAVMQTGDPEAASRKLKRLIENE